LWPHPLGKVGFVDDEIRQQIALWRLGVLGPLMSARLEHGDVRAYLQEAAERLHRMPDGREVTLSARTIETWHYWYQHDGLTGLMPKSRSDKGRTRAVRPEVAELLLRAKAEKPRRSIRRLIKMLVRAKVVQPDELSRSSVHRLLATAGISWRPARAEVRERRSFITECAGDLGVGDSMHGPLVIKPDGTLHKSYLLTQLDCTTRYVLHSYFACGEAAVEQEYGLKQAILRYGPFRAYYVDRGPAYIAHSLRVICGELGIRLLHTGSGDCQAKGVIERWHRTVREELEDELPAAPVSIGDLNSKLWAWLAVEYHAREHDTTKRLPREHFLEQADQLRPVPPGKNLDEVFLHRATRKVRQDGTVRWDGGYLEVRPELVGSKVELRFDPSDPATLPKVFVHNQFFCDTVPLDRLANADRKRRRIHLPVPRLAPSGLDPLGLIEAEHYRRGRPVDTSADDADSPKNHDKDNQENAS
jgi:transposase InsO family protein